MTKFVLKVGEDETVEIKNGLLHRSETLELRQEVIVLANIAAFWKRDEKTVALNTANGVHMSVSLADTEMRDAFFEALVKELERK